MLQEVRPSSLSTSTSVQHVELRLQVGADEHAKDWRVSVAQVSNVCVSGVVCNAASSDGTSNVIISIQLRPEAPGMLSLILYGLSSASSCNTRPHEVLVAPVLVAPNPAVQQEMEAVFDAMKAVVVQQLQQAGHADPQATAGQLTWSLHFQQLLWDMQTILDCAAAKPGCLPPEVAAEVLTGVMEFLGHHGCWCSISWLLAEAIRARLLKHAKAAAAQRLQETQAFAGLGGTQAMGAMCAGFIADLAASPVKSSQHGQSAATTTNSSSALHTDNAAAASCSGQSSYHTLDDTCCSDGPLVQSSNVQQSRQHGRTRRCASSWHGWNVVLTATAAVLVLLLVVLHNMRELLPCQDPAEGLQQLVGCRVALQPRLRSVGLGSAAGRAQLLGDVLLYMPFMALLCLAVSMASKVCLVL